MEFPSYWTEISGLKVHYKNWGKGPPVLLVHGGGNDWHEWKNNLAAFSRKFQVIALDLPGFGMTTSPEFPVSPSWSAVFLKNFLESLNISRAYLVGHSMGAMISINLAAQFPECVNKLVLIDATGIGKLSRQGRLLLTLFRTLDRWRGQKRGPGYLSRPVEQWMVRDHLSEIKCPVLIIWGQNDLYLPASHSRVAQSLIQGSRLHIFPRCGHAPQRECQDEFNNLVLQFLDGPVNEIDSALKRDSQAAVPYKMGK